MNASVATRKSGQVLAGIQLYRICTESREFVNAWYALAMTRPDLFSDVYNAESKVICPRFKDNRHDQSVLSVLTKQATGIRILTDETAIVQENSEKPILATRIRA